MIEKQILSSPVTVDPFLAEMDLDRATLIQVIQYADAQRALCTSNDLRGFDLITAHGKAARGLREAFCGPIWQKDETDNQPGILNPARKIRIIPCNFDENAGRVDREPTNRHVKGNASKFKTSCNGTGWLPGLPMPEPIAINDYVTWLLGSYLENEYLGAELSLPLEFSNRQFKKLTTRILLVGPDGPMGAGGVRPADNGPVDIVDISVKRK
jgi:hypothetical protein